MANAGSVTVKLDTKKLDEILAKAPERASLLVARGALAVRGRAASLAPVDTGALRASIAEREVGQFKWQVYAGVEYAIYQEFGTYKMAAHPFLGPAVEATRKEYNKSWSELFKTL